MESAVTSEGVTRTHDVAGWRAAEIAIIVSLAGLLYFGTVLDLVQEWWTVSSSSYGLLVPPVAAYIVYLRRGTIFAVPSQPDVWGLALIAFACVTLLAGGLAAEFFLRRISIVLLLAGLVWTFWGRERLRNLVFPFLLLATMVPLPAIVHNALAAPLQLFSSDVATSLAQAVGVTIYSQGNIIHLANASLGVAEACSGLQSLTALMVGSLLLGFVENTGVTGRIVLFLAAAPLAILMNVVRIAGTAILADYHVEYAMGFYHSFSGWLVFMLGFGCLWLLGRGVSRWSGTKSE